MDGVIHFKLHSGTTQEQVAFYGNSISVSDLRACISEKKKLGKDKTTRIALCDVSTGKEYTDDTLQLIKNSRVIVKRACIFSPSAETPAPVQATTTLVPPPAHRVFRCASLIRETLSPRMSDGCRVQGTRPHTRTRGDCTYGTLRGGSRTVSGYQYKSCGLVHRGGECASPSAPERGQRSASSILYVPSVWLQRALDPKLHWPGIAQERTDRYPHGEARAIGEWDAASSFRTTGDPRSERVRPASRFSK